jgi:hypothetical protein
MSYKLWVDWRAKTKHFMMLHRFSWLPRPAGQIWEEERQIGTRHSPSGLYQYQVERSRATCRYVRLCLGSLSYSAENGITSVGMMVQTYSYWFVRCSAVQCSSMQHSVTEDPSICTTMHVISPECIRLHNKAASSFTWLHLMQSNFIELHRRKSIALNAIQWHRILVWETPSYKVVPPFYHCLTVYWFVFRWVCTVHCLFRLLTRCLVPFLPRQCSWQRLCTSFCLYFFDHYSHCSILFAT